MQSYNFILINVVYTRLKVWGRGVNELLKYGKGCVQTDLKFQFYFNISFSLKEKNNPFDLQTMLSKKAINLPLIFKSWMPYFQKHSFWFAIA